MGLLKSTPNWKAYRTPNDKKKTVWVFMDFFYYEIVFFVQALFSGEGAEHGRKLVTPQLNGTETGDRPHTLEEYATDHFR